MNENISTPSTSSHKRFSLFGTEARQPYDIRNMYPEDYKAKLEQEIQQWTDSFKTLSIEANSLAENLNKGYEKTVKVDAKTVISDDKCFENFFDHTLYYDYLLSIDKFCKRVACAVEEHKSEKLHDERKQEVLHKKMALIDRLMMEDIKKYF